MSSTQVAHNPSDGSAAGNATSDAVEYTASRRRSRTVVRDRSSMTYSKTQEVNAGKLKSVARLHWSPEHLQTQPKDTLFRENMKRDLPMTSPALNRSVLSTSTDRHQAPILQFENKTGRHRASAAATPPVPTSLTHWTRNNESHNSYPTPQPRSAPHLVDKNGFLISHTVTPKSSQYNRLLFGNSNSSDMPFRQSTWDGDALHFPDINQASKLGSISSNDNTLAYAYGPDPPESAPLSPGTARVPWAPNGDAGAGYFQSSSPSEAETPGAEFAVSPTNVKMPGSRIQGDGDTSRVSQGASITCFGRVTNQLNAPRRSVSNAVAGGRFNDRDSRGFGQAGDAPGTSNGYSAMRALDKSFLSPKIKTPNGRPVTSSDFKILAKQLSLGLTPATKRRSQSYLGLAHKSLLTSFPTAPDLETLGRMTWAGTGSCVGENLVLGPAPPLDAIPFSSRGSLKLDLDQWLLSDTADVPDTCGLFGGDDGASGAMHLLSRAVQCTVYADLGYAFCTEQMEYMSGEDLMAAVFKMPLQPRSCLIGFSANIGKTSIVAEAQQRLGPEGFDEEEVEGGAAASANLARKGPKKMAGSAAANSGGAQPIIRTHAKPFLRVPLGRIRPRQACMIKLSYIYKLGGGGSMLSYEHVSRWTPSTNSEWHAAPMMVELQSDAQVMPPPSGSNASRSRKGQSAVMYDLSHHIRIISHAGTKSVTSLTPVTLRIKPEYQDTVVQCAQMVWKTSHRTLIAIELESALPLRTYAVLQDPQPVHSSLLLSPNADLQTQLAAGDGSGTPPPPPPMPSVPSRSVVLVSFLPAFHLLEKAVSIPAMAPGRAVSDTTNSSFAAVAGASLVQTASGGGGTALSATVAASMSLSALARGALGDWNSLDLWIVIDLSTPLSRIHEVRQMLMAASVMVEGLPTTDPSRRFNVALLPGRAEPRGEESAGSGVEAPAAPQSQSQSKPSSNPSKSIDPLLLFPQECQPMQTDTVKHAASWLSSMSQDTARILPWVNSLSQLEIWIADLSMFQKSDSLHSLHSASHSAPGSRNRRRCVLALCSAASTHAADEVYAPLQAKRHREQQMNSVGKFPSPNPNSGQPSSINNNNNNNADGPGSMTTNRPPSLVIPPAVLAIAEESSGALDGGMMTPDGIPSNLRGVYHPSPSPAGDRQGGRALAGDADAGPLNLIDATVMVVVFRDDTYSFRNYSGAKSYGSNDFAQIVAASRAPALGGAGNAFNQNVMTQVLENPEHNAKYQLQMTSTTQTAPESHPFLHYLANVNGGFLQVSLTPSTLLSDAQLALSCVVAGQYIVNPALVCVGAKLRAVLPRTLPIAVPVDEQLQLLIRVSSVSPTAQLQLVGRWHDGSSALLPVSISHRSAKIKGNGLPLLMAMSEISNIFALGGPPTLISEYNLRRHVLYHALTHGLVTPYTSMTLVSLARFHGSVAVQSAIPSGMTPGTVADARNQKSLTLHWFVALHINTASAVMEACRAEGADFAAAALHLTLLSALAAQREPAGHWGAANGKVWDLVCNGGRLLTLPGREARLLSVAAQQVCMAAEEALRMALKAAKPRTVSEDGWTTVVVLATLHHRLPNCRGAWRNLEAKAWSWLQIPDNWLAPPEGQETALPSPQGQGLQGPAPTGVYSPGGAGYLVALRGAGSSAAKAGPGGSTRGGGVSPGEGFIKALSLLSRASTLPA